MKTPIYLEDYRNNDVNKRALSLSTEPPLFIYFTFNESAISAYSETGRNITELEISTDSINNGLNCYPAISGWYQSLSSFVNTLLKVLCIRTARDHKKIQSISLSNQYLLILVILEIDVEVLHEKELCEKLEDFELFYCNLPYNFLESEAIVYKTANFSKLPTHANQVDVFQSLLIALEVFEKLRFVISGLDLMPNITLMTESKKVVFERLGVLRDKVLAPAFKDILIKHRLKTRLNLTAKFPNYPVSSLFDLNHVYALSKYQEDNKYTPKSPAIETKILSGFYSDFMKKFDRKEDQYGLNFLSPDNPFFLTKKN